MQCKFKLRQCSCITTFLIGARSVPLLFPPHLGTTYCAHQTAQRWATESRCGSSRLSTTRAPAAMCSKSEREMAILHAVRSNSNTSETSSQDPTRLPIHRDIRSLTRTGVLPKQLTVSEAARLNFGFRLMKFSVWRTPPPSSIVSSRCQRTRLASL